MLAPGAGNAGDGSSNNDDDQQVPSSWTRYHNIDTRPDSDTEAKKLWDQIATPSPFSQTVDVKDHQLKQVEKTAGRLDRRVQDSGTTTQSSSLLNSVSGSQEPLYLAT
jgi:hypothetical protein